MVVLPKRTQPPDGATVAFLLNVGLVVPGRDVGYDVRAFPPSSVLAAVQVSLPGLSFGARLVRLNHVLPVNLRSTCNIPSAHRFDAPVRLQRLQQLERGRVLLASQA